MIYSASNLNYGYSVATNKSYVAIGNPSVFIYSNTTFETGSVEVLQYSDESDSYIHNSTIKKYLYPDILLTTEISELITTETDLELLIDYTSLPLSASKFGKSVAIYDDTIVIGDPLFFYKLNSNYSSFLTGSTVDIFQLSMINTASYVTSLTNSFDSSYDYNTTFGESVSIYKDLIAVGASSISSSQGAVYLYKNTSGTWNYYQCLTGSNTIGSKFGSIVKIDASGSYNIIVGNGAISGSVYVFSYNSSSGYWLQSSILTANRTLTSSLQEINNQWPPYITSSANPDGFGNSVAIYGNNIAVGAPTDTYYTQYDASTIYHSRGAAYFFENCSGDNKNWSLMQKTFGSSDILNDNYFGWDVEVYETSSVISSLKTNFPFSSSYLSNTLYKKFDCNPNDSIYNVLGQYVLYQKDTSSYWNIITTLTKKKQYGEPYSVYGYDTALYKDCLVVGSPVYSLIDENVTIEPLLLTLSATDVSTVGASDAEIYLSASGGTSPYYIEYDISNNWSNVTSPITWSGVPAGDYPFIVYDALSNTTTGSIHVYTPGYTSSAAYSFTKAITNTNYVYTGSLPQLNVNNATITTVSWSMDSTGRSNGRYENIDVVPRTVTHGSDIIVTAYSGSSEVVSSGILPIRFGPTAFAAYDGVTDYAGTSGITQTQISTTSSIMSASTAGPFDIYSGSGTIPVVLIASGSAYATGSVVYLQSNTPNVGTTVTITYVYTVPRQ